MSAIRTPTAVPVAPPVPEAPDAGGYDDLLTPALARCMESLARDLPQLLVTHPGKCVAYVDGRFLKIADTQTELYLLCLNELGLSHDQFIVTGIVPDAGGVIEYQPR